MTLPLDLPLRLMEIIDSYWKPKTHYECVHKRRARLGSTWIESAAGWLYTDSGTTYFNNDRITGNVISRSPQMKTFVLHNEAEKLLTVVEWNGQLQQSFETSYVLITTEVPYFENSILYLSRLCIHEVQIANHGTFLLGVDETLYEISLVYQTVLKIGKFDQQISHCASFNQTYYIECDDFCFIRDSSGTEHKIGIHDDFVLEDDLVVHLFEDKITWYDGQRGWTPIVREFADVSYVLLKDRYVYILFDDRVEIWSHEPQLSLYASVPIPQQDIFPMQLYSHGIIFFTDKRALFYE